MIYIPKNAMSYSMMLVAHTETNIIGLNLRDKATLHKIYWRIEMFRERKIFLANEIPARIVLE